MKGQNDMKQPINASGYEAVHVEIENRKLDGDACLRVVKGEDKRMRFDENTYARLRDVTFHNGIIRVRMLSRLLPDAPDFARGFIGIVFRAAQNNAEFESFYIRPTNAMTDDPVRRAHGCQYFAYPGYTFAYFREYGITGYEAPVDIGLDTWVTLEARIHGSYADFLLDGKEVLHVSDLKHGPDAMGGVGLFVDIGTEGFFRDLEIIPDENSEAEKECHN